MSFSEICIDKDSRCHSWTGYCKRNKYVKRNCLKTCGKCKRGKELQLFGGKIQTKNNEENIVHPY